MKELDKVYAQNVANEYAPKTESKVVALKKLDKKAKSGAKVFGYAFGIVSALVLGTGMSFALGQFGETTQNMIIGIAVGIVGIIGVSINYPIYQKILKSGKEKYASDIIELARQISEE